MSEWPRLQRLPLEVPREVGTHYVVRGVPPRLRKDVLSQFCVKQRHNPYVRVQPKPLVLAHEDGELLHLPRAGGEQLFGPAPRAREWQGGSPLAADMLLPLRPHQQAAVTQVVATLARTPQVMLQAPCGGGKTTTSIAIALQLGVKTLVLVHTSVLLRQWVERVGSTCSASVSVVQGKKVDTSGDFIVAMEQTLATGKDVDLSGVGLTIFDEAHHAPCNFLRLALRVPCLLLGLSATPRRDTDGTTPALWYMFGDRVVMDAPRPTVRVFWHALPSADVRMMRIGDKPLYVQTRKRLAEHPRRQAALEALLLRLRDEGRKVLALTDFVEHAELTAAAVDGLAVHGGNSRKVDAEGALAAGKVVVATHALVKEGTDWAAVDTMVWLLPPAFSAMEQTVGRLRPRGGGFEPQVHDCTDMALDESRRAAFYRKHGCVFEPTHQ